MTPLQTRFTERERERNKNDDDDDDVEDKERERGNMDDGHFCARGRSEKRKIERGNDAEMPEFQRRRRRRFFLFVSSCRFKCMRTFHLREEEGMAMLCIEMGCIRWALGCVYSSSWFPLAAKRNLELNLLPNSACPTQQCRIFHPARNHQLESFPADFRQVG